MSQAGLGVRAFFRIKAREADEKELCTLRPRFLYKVYGKPRRVPCAKQMKIPDMLRPVHPDVRSAFATRPGTFSGAGSGFAPGRTDCASLWFLFTHSVSSWSPAVSKRRSASQAWVPYPVFSRVYPHSDRRMPCVSGIIFRQRLQILKQGSPLRTARRDRTVRSNAMRSRCFFSLARRTLEVGIWSRIGMRMYARRANSTRFGTVCTHIATRNTEVLRALTCRTFSTDCRFGRQNKQSRKSFKFV